MSQCALAYGYSDGFETFSMVQAERLILEELMAVCQL